jgi:hypothetical protein
MGQRTDRIFGAKPAYIYDPQTRVTLIGAFWVNVRSYGLAT